VNGWLMVDGPMAGRVVTTPSPTPVMFDTDEDFPSRTLQYHLHKWAMLGHVVHLGSVHADQADVDEQAIWAAITSAGAQQAATDAWCTAGVVCPSGQGHKHRVSRACYPAGFTPVPVTGHG